MTEFNNITEVSEEIKAKLDSSSNKKKVITLYAFNGTGKTRISNEFTVLNNSDNEDNEPKIKVLCYSAFLEDLFSWNNENYTLSFASHSWEAKLIKDQGLEKNIIENFQKILNTKTEPFFDLEKGKIRFNIPSGDDKSKTNIKISRGEESIFIWSIFQTILETVINELNVNENNRSTDLFNDLEYIIIDDPVSSIDDTRIITLAMEITQLLESCKEENNFKFLITTHHPLFYNVLMNFFKRDNECKDFKYILSKNNSKLELEDLGDSPFGYHLLVKDEIKNAIETENIQKYHFNLFRGLLEKTANFLGLSNWDNCINGENKNEFIRLLNLYSHNKLEPMEYRDVSDKDKALFKKQFTEFIENFKYN
jgi:hypothetical protein